MDKRSPFLEVFVVTPLLSAPRLIRLLIWAAGSLCFLITSTVIIVTQPFVSPIPSPSPAADPTKLETHVRRLTVDFYPRSHDQRQQMDAASQYIADAFKATGAEVSFQEFDVNGNKYRNVIARFGPHTGPLLVIGAHYDSNGYTSDQGLTNYAPETHTPGADDNASGVAGLLELARLLGQKPQSRSIELVAYALEELPHFRTEHMGSAWHARSLTSAKREVQLMLSLEMIGYFSDEPDSQHYPVTAMGHFYPNQGNFIAIAGRLNDVGIIRKTKALMAGTSNLPVYSINAPRFIDGVDFSDHQNYWNEGFPALMVTDTAFFRNGNYHTADDTYDSLDYPRMAKVVQAVYAITQNY